MTTLRLLIITVALLGLAACSFNASITPPTFGEKQHSST
jgi:hypothetical protein